MNLLPVAAETELVPDAIGAVADDLCQLFSSNG
jgi:hypothetical protein